MNYGVILLSILSFFIIFAFAILILIIVFKDKKTTTTTTAAISNVPDYTTDTTVKSTAVVSRINWSEINRGFPSTNFPPCCEPVAEVKKIFTILQGYNLQKKYMMLLDVYSIILCQDAQVRIKICSDTFINDRLADLNTYGADANDKTAIDIVKANTNLNNTKMGKLLVMATNLIEKELANIQNDNAISKSDKEQIMGFATQFYRLRYDFINKRCP
jgi:hypothetical protein